jgi:hypothetical protein
MGWLNSRTVSKLAVLQLGISYLVTIDPHTPLAAVLLLYLVMVEKALLQGTGERFAQSRPDSRLAVRSERLHHQRQYRCYSS